MHWVVDAVPINGIMLVVCDGRKKCSKDCKCNCPCRSRSGLEFDIAFSFDFGIVVLFFIVYSFKKTSKSPAKTKILRSETI